MTLDLKIFSLNCWGLAFISKDRKARYAAIAEALAANQFDVVCLQEVWVNKDYNFLREELSNVLPYSHYFYSGVTGSGICILSKHPIEETFFHQWSVNGYIHKLHHGDWWAGKGVGLCRLKVEHKTETYFVNVFVTHLHAEYDRASDDYQAHRVLQAYDTAQFILLTTGSADLTVLAGDLNTEPGDLAYKVMLAVPGLYDSYVEFGDTSPEKFATCESPRNSYTPCELVKDGLLGKRLDYIMYHPGTNVKVDLKSYSLPLPARVPKKTFSYSDHEGILAELSIRKDYKSTTNSPEDRAKKVVLQECIMLCKDALKSISMTNFFYWLEAVLLFILFAISLIVPALMTSSVFDNFPTLFAILRTIITVLMLFCFLMATLWNRIEKHGVLSGKLAMEISLKKIEQSEHS